jgi:hypothetical protein
MKKIFLLFALAFSLNASAQIPYNGLKGYFPFTGNANDASTTGNNATVNSATLTTDRNGNSNSAYYFNGGADINIPNNTAYNNSPTSASWSFWVKYSSSSVSGGSGALPCIINRGDGIGQPGLIVYEEGGRIEVYLSGGSNNGGGANYATNDGQWHHVVLTYTLGTSFTLYIDGQLAAPTGALAGGSHTGYPIVIGKDAGNGFFKRFTGSVDDLVIYNREITGTDVAALYGKCFVTTTVTDTLIMSSITGINSLPQNFGIIKVYPNPANNVVNFEVSNPSSSYNIKITNSVGTSVYSSVMNQASVQINRNSLGANGLYFIQITDTGGNILDTKKLMLE